MYLKIISHASCRFEELFALVHDELGLSVQRVSDVGQALAALEFKPDGAPKKIIYIDNIKTWVFPEHSLFYPLMRFSQYLGLAQRDHMRVINWDEHEDFYYGVDKSQMQRWGNVPNDSRSQPMETFVANVSSHTKQFVGITSFFYPFIWKNELKEYFWRRPQRMFPQSNTTKKVVFGRSPNWNYYLYHSGRIPLKGQERSLDYTQWKSRPGNVPDFGNDTLSAVYSIDLDFFFKPSNNISRHQQIESSSMSNFSRDLDGLNRQGTVSDMNFIATSPGFVNGKLIPELLNKVLKKLEEKR